MYQYYVFEIMKDLNGEYAHQVYWAFDANADKARLKGLEKYHERCAAAAVSDKPHHTVTLFDSDGRSILNDRFDKDPSLIDVVPTPEPEE